jgi:hypothetical protein
MAPQPKKPRGRPKKGERAMMEALTIRFPSPIMREVEAIQAERRDQPEKGAVIRELVVEALDARAKRKAEGK